MTDEVMFNSLYYRKLYDYSILQLSQHQFYGINEVIDIVNDYLNIDRPVLANIAYQFMINQQIANKSYYFELAGNLPQARMIDKFDMGKYVINELKLVLQGTNKVDLIEKAVEAAFEWYVKDFLQQDRT